MSELGLASGPRFSVPAISLAFALGLSSAAAFDSLPCFPTNLRLLPGESITTASPCFAVPEPFDPQRVCLRQRRRGSMV